MGVPVGGKGGGVLVSSGVLVGGAEVGTAVESGLQLVIIMDNNTNKMIRCLCFITIY